MLDLYSDTQTRPSDAMRRAMANAEVGDEQRGEDPTVNALCEKVAELLGKEAAVFLPSGTMCNEIALMVHCRSGDEILCHGSAHIVNYEGGGPSALAGAVVTALPGERGMFTADTVRAAIRPTSRYAPVTRLLEIENTANMAGGVAWPLADVQAVSQVARDAGLIVHMDGARLLNAVVATGTSAADYSAATDSVWIDFSKGLGAPVGAAMAGSANFIEAVWKWKQRIGGAMRQAGIIAAGALYGLENNIERLAEDNAAAKSFAEVLAESPNFSIDPTTVDTNIIIFDLTDKSADAAKLSARILAEADVRIGAVGPHTLRAVTHMDVDPNAVRTAAERIVRL